MKLKSCCEDAERRVQNAERSDYRVILRRSKLSRVMFSSALCVLRFAVGASPRPTFNYQFLILNYKIAIPHKSGMAIYY